ncbi:uncharacterized protein FTOL_13227 [Fusarium torulosum]|uniref:Uncharacterized protein n=1 Tax=Fusarium torulosum TaxID=33205 RepID=A0AAE8MLS4_9HYPO|nr:uncharacterized protein FTOL_13227 [Fusarium torulosum]
MLTVTRDPDIGNTHFEASVQL